MNEYPILFKTEMVQALLDDRKTQTRRLINAKTPEDFALLVKISAGINVDEQKAELIKTSSPYGQPGDLLWVRENWQFFGADLMDWGECTFKFATGELHTWNVWDEDAQVDYTEWAQEQFEKLHEKGVFKMDEDQERPDDDLHYIRTDVKQPWSPSIHLRKVAARIWLQVVDVQIEQLHSISEHDSIAEGIEYRTDEDGREFKDYSATCSDEFPFGDTYFTNPVLSYKSLWEKINGADSWKYNRWVWVVKFNLLSTTGRPVLRKEAAL